MRKLLSRGIMKKILITLVLFEIILISYINIFNLSNVREGNKEFAETSLNKLIIEKQKGLEYLFNQVEYETENLGMWVNEVIDDEVTDEELNGFDDNYYVNKNSILTNRFSSDDEGEYVSNIFYSYKSKLTDKQKSDIINTSMIENQFKKSFDRIPNAVWAYIITNDNMIRMYPALSENVDNFRYGHDFKQDVYYYMADEINNPERKPVWTNPYVDWLGKGLLITCSYPIYNDNKMIGVVCIDIGLDYIRDSISDLSVEGTGVSFLIDEEGKIIYYPKYELAEEEQGLVVKDHIDIYAITKYEKQMFKEMIQEKDGSKTYYDNVKQKFLLYKNINRLNWIIGINVDREAYFEENILVNDNFLGLMLFSLTLIILLLIYYYRSLSKPIFNLVDDIQGMGNKYIDNFELNENNDEIKILDGTFKNLRFKLDEYIDMLSYKNNELQTIFDNIPGMLYIIDSDFNLLMFNSKSEELMLYKRNDFNNKKCYELLYNRNAACNDCPVKGCIESKCGGLVEIQHGDKIFSVSCHPIYNADKSIREIIVFSMDKTQEIIKNLELANAEKFSIIGQVSASVTHQLKNNISVIKGACYLLNEIESEHEFDINEVREVLNELNEGIRDAENTIYNLMEFNKNGDNVSCINIISVIEQMLVIEKNNLYKNKIEVVKKFDSDEIFMNTCLNPLKFIFSNLIRNSIESMKNDGGYLKLNVFKNKKFIHIEVRDTGEGMDENIKNNIFDPFFTTKENGSGLGLWIVKEQVKKLNGHIYCESKKDKGTNFIIVLPINLQNS